MSARRGAAVLDAVVRPGSIVQVVGDSGSGLSGLARDMVRGRADAAMVGQDAEGALSGLRDTVCEEAAFGLEQRGTPVEAMERRVGAMLARLGLSGVAEHSPAALSGGQTRRLALATTAALRPGVLVLDNPGAGLDAESLRAVRGLCAEIARAGGCVLVLGYAPLEGLPGEVWWWDGLELSLGVPERTFDLPAPVAPGRGREVFAGLVAERGGDFRLGPVTVGVRRGAVTWLRGPNGCGKTSLLRVMAGLDGRGRAGLFGIGRRRESARRVALALQHSADQVIDSAAEAMVGSADACRRWGLDPGAHPLDLSASDLRCAQVLGAARLGRPVLALDEPDVGCDAPGWQRLHRILAECLRAGAGVVLTCHNPRFMEQVGRYALVEAHDLGESAGAVG
ncbi:ATP-binding cassette domain-containing protein [Corynebacterium mastitidis]|uniref:ATP-binding cassette domain-containing protein n=1 Tax=Corynebacterium mastitidis TaxID=161890 RepID=A0ABU8NYD4_9CORY